MASCVDLLVIQWLALCMDPAAGITCGSCWWSSGWHHLWNLLVVQRLASSVDPAGGPAAGIIFGSCWWFSSWHHLWILLVVQQLASFVDPAGGPAVGIMHGSCLVVQWLALCMDSYIFQNSAEECTAELTSRPRLSVSICLSNTRCPFSIRMTTMFYSNKTAYNC